MTIPDFDILAGEDGRVWLCIVVTSSDADRIIEFAVALAGVARSAKAKIRTAELTRYKVPLVR